MKKIFFLLLIIKLSLVLCFAQSDFVSIKADINACELNSLHLDLLRTHFTNLPTSRIIAKSFAGKDEDKFVSEKRMNYIKKFLEQNKRYDLSRVEFVDSGKLETDENPKIEFYIAQAGEAEGKHWLVIYSQPNKTPCLDCCEDGFTPKNLGSKSKSKNKTIKQSKKRRN